MTPKRLAEHRTALNRFYAAYIEYLEASSPQNDAPDTDEIFRLRGQVSALLPAAHKALTAAGVNPYLAPPPAFGGLIRRGLANVVFAHELPGFRIDNETVQLVIDSVRYASAELAEDQKALRRKRRNPLYWIDRLLRAVLGVPAYLVSLIFRVPMSRLDDSPLGTGLRIFALVIETLGIYFAGHAAHWW